MQDPLTSLTPEDEGLRQWLYQYVNPQEVNVKIIGEARQLLLDFPDPFSARAAWDRRFALKGFDLRLLVRGQEVHSGNPRMTDTLSRWVNANRLELLIDRDICTVMVHQAEPPFNFLVVQPYKGLEEIVNGQDVARLIGRPLSIVDSEIAEAKAWLIRQAVDRRTEIVTHSYSYDWMGRRWISELSGRYEARFDEVVIKTIFGEPWQKGFWDNTLPLPQVG